MIEKLLLKNFQGTRKREIEFDPRVTTLVGETNSGKSSVLRALRWIALNRPSGNEAIRHGAASVRGKLTIDGHTVERIKSEKENTYALDGKEFKAFSTSVPEPIAELLNVSELNFQQQLEPHFWLTLSPGQLAKELNALADLATIDIVLARIASRLKRAGTAYEVSERILTQARGRKRHLARAVQANALLKQIEALETVRIHLNGECESLEAMIEEIKEAQDSSDIQPIDLGPATKLAKELADLERDCDELSDTITSIRETERQLCQATERLEKTQADLRSIPLCPTCGNPVPSLPSSARTCI